MELELSRWDVTKLFSTPKSMVLRVYCLVHGTHMPYSLSLVSLFFCHIIFSPVVLVARLLGCSGGRRGAGEVGPASLLRSTSSALPLAIGHGSALGALRGGRDEEFEVGGSAAAARLMGPRQPHRTGWRRRA